MNNESTVIDALTLLYLDKNYETLDISSPKDLAEKYKEYKPLIEKTFASEQKLRTISKSKLGL